MIFLIEYDRDQGRIVTLETFSDSEKKKAEESRLKLELEQRNDNEVVVLEAASQAALRRTHRRYFENWSELLMASA